MLMDLDKNHFIALVGLKLDNLVKEPLNHQVTKEIQL